MLAKKRRKGVICQPNELNLIEFVIAYRSSPNAPNSALWSITNLNSDPKVILKCFNDQSSLNSFSLYVLCFISALFTKSDGNALISQNYYDFVQLKPIFVQMSPLYGASQLLFFLLRQCDSS